MQEKITNTVIEALAETIQRLRVDVIILNGENDRLREENTRLKNERSSESNG